ncbi:MAG: hypothetical protein PHD82_17050, partial [Candidatus Riflebacteria bacterium]|nr:hypothetical protein [Candidatus Riflebacteria bacterium]
GVSDFLITVEAMQIYLQKLSHDGVIAVNISNRYLDLIPLIGALAETCGLSSAFFSDHSFDDAAPENYQRIPSLYALLSRSSANLPVEGQPFRHRWQPCPIKEGAPAWTDNFSSLLPFLCLDMTHSTAFKGFSGKEENGD